MTALDIRTTASTPDTIVFGNKDTNGAGKAYGLERNHGEEQFYLMSRSGDALHVKYSDVDSLIKALQAAKQLWG